MLLKISGLKNFANLTGKHLCWSLFLIKLQVFRPATLLKRDSNGGAVFFKKCKIFKNTFFYLFTVNASVCSENLGKILVRNN